MRQTFLISGLLLIFATNSIAGGPWIRNQGQGFAQFGFSGLFYNAAFGPNGTDFAAYRSMSDVTLQLYAEYGLAKNLEIRAILPFKLLNTGVSSDPVANPFPAGSLSGIGNVGVGLKYGLLDGAVKLSAGIDVLANTFKSSDQLGLRTGYEATTVLPYLSVGSGTERTYYFVEAGYGFMNGNYSNFLKLNGEFGYKISKRLWAGVTMDFRLPARNGSFVSPEAYRFTANYLNDQKYLGLGIKASYDFIPDRFGVNLSLIGALAGENVPFSRSYNAGVFIKW